MCFFKARTSRPFSHKGKLKYLSSERSTVYPAISVSRAYLSFFTFITRDAQAYHQKQCHPVPQPASGNQQHLALAFLRIDGTNLFYFITI